MTYLMLSWVDNWFVMLLQKVKLKNTFGASADWKLTRKKTHNGSFDEHNLKNFHPAQFPAC